MFTKLHPMSCPEANSDQPCSKPTPADLLQWTFSKSNVKWLARRGFLIIVAFFAIQCLNAQSPGGWSGYGPKDLPRAGSATDQIAGELQAKQKNPPSVENADEIRRDLEWVQKAITSLEEYIEWSSSQQASIENVTKYSSSLSNRFNELQARLGMLDTNKPTAVPDFIGQWVYLANGIATHVPMQRSYLRSDSDYSHLDDLCNQQMIKGWLEQDRMRQPITIPPAGLQTAMDTLKEYMKTAGAFIQKLARLDGEAAGEMASFRDYIQKANGLKGELLTYKGALTSLSERSARKSQAMVSLPYVISIIGGLCLLAMLAVRSFPAAAMLIWIESGQMIQFITVMILLSTILVLGLADTLKENTLGTLLGGIGGYVLSQGVGRAAARQAVRQMEERNKRDLGKAD